MKTAFIFPGQGAQKVGMGKQLADDVPQVAELYKQANEIVGYDLADICFNGPVEKLNTTEISQPALFVTSAACLMALRQSDLKAMPGDVDLSSVEPVFCAGLSLGEYSALYAAGAVDFEAGLRLVQLRGESMQRAADMRKGTMVSVLGLTVEQAKELCRAILDEGISEDDGGQSVLEAVNFNCPGQVVISGSINACRRAAQRAEEFGASRAIELQVAGAFHTVIMQPAAEKLAQALAESGFVKPQYQVVANVDALVYDNASEIPDKLMRQLVSPVLWQQSVEYMLDQGVERFVEIGVGRVLTGLVKKTARARKLRPVMLNTNLI